MALVLVEPTGAVTTYKSGLIAVRCSDFPGPARGTLSVVSDALSVSGSVVKDEQTVSLPTTLAATNLLTQAASVSDSVRVPTADLNLRANVRYQIYVTLRTTGSPPSNAQYDTSWTMYSRTNNSSGSGGAIYGDSAQTVRAQLGLLPRPLVANYTMKWGGEWSRAISGPSVPTYLNLRGWGISGGTQAVLFDMIYLLPYYNVNDNDPDWNFADVIINNWGFEPALFNSNDTVNPDQDNDATSAPWLGKFSVMSGWRAPWIEQGFPDFQEGDDEATYWHHSPGEWQTDPKEYLAYVVGGTQVDGTTLLDEGFLSFVQGTNWDFVTGSPGTWSAYSNSADCIILGHHGSIGIYGQVDGVGGFDEDNTVVSGWEPKSDNLLRCYIGDDAALTNLERCAFGYATVNTGVGDSTSDPRNYKPSLIFPSGCILTAKFKVEKSLSDVYAGLGVTTSMGLAADYENILCELLVKSSGDVELSLRHDRGNPHTTGQFGEIILDGPVSVGSGYALGDEWYVKFERLGYALRAKAWAVGDTEPDWQVTGYELMVRSGMTTAPGIEYPYDDNYGTEGTNIRYDPRGNNLLFPMIRAMRGAVGVAGDDRIKLDCTAMKIEYNPGIGTPSVMGTKVLKHDDSEVLDSTVAIPWGSHRWVQGLARRRRFGTGNFDDLGFNIRVWKNPSFPFLTPAIIGDVWERRVTTPSGPIHLDLTIRSYEENDQDL